MKRFLLVLALSALAATTGAVAAEAPLQFRITEGRILNAFFREGPNAAHLLLSAGKQPRVLVAFPAGNSGVGVWFDEASVPVRWTLGEVKAADEEDARGRRLRGITADASVDASRLVVRDAVLGSVRVLRDFQLGVAYPASVATTPQVSARRVTWARPRVDGAAGYSITLELLDGRISGGNGAPLLLSAERDGQPMRLRLTALTGETPLTPLGHDDLLNASAGSDPRARDALRFLAYQDKFLAGSWRFDTYFGRDTLMSLRLLMPALQPDAIEDGLGSVLGRLNAGGEVPHEEDIGEFAVLRHRKEGGDGDAPIYDYGMIDDDVMLAPVVAAYLLDQPQGPARARAFLARKITSGGTLGAALARNFAFVIRSARAFARRPVAEHLVALKPGRKTGQWRDSEQGLAGGRYPYDVNAVFVPAALSAIARIERQGLLADYALPAQHQQFAQAADMAVTWTKQAPPLFAVTLASPQARRAIADYSKRLGIDPAPALASIPDSGLRFDALALDASGKPIPVLHSDVGFALLFAEPPASTVDAMVDSVLRPFPAGLLTGVGMLVADPAFAGADIQATFGPSAYHGTVVWSWQQALMAAGLQRQSRRDDLPAATRAHLQAAQKTLWQVIDATTTLRTSELWSWSYADGHYRAEPFGQSSGDADESNAAQLWSTVYLAIPPPAR